MLRQQNVVNNNLFTKLHILDRTQATGAEVLRGIVHLEES